MLAKRRYHELVYLKDTTNTAVEIPTFWRNDKQSAADSTSGQSWEHGCSESEATTSAG